MNNDYLAKLSCSPWGCEVSQKWDSNLYVGYKWLQRSKIICCISFCKYALTFLSVATVISAEKSVFVSCLHICCFAVIWTVLYAWWSVLLSSQKAKVEFSLSACANAYLILLCHDQHPALTTCPDLLIRGTGDSSHLTSTAENMNPAAALKLKVIYNLTWQASVMRLPLLPLKPITKKKRREWF